MFGLELQNVHSRTEAGALRANNSVEAHRYGFAAGVSGGWPPAALDIRRETTLAAKHQRQGPIRSGDRIREARGGDAGDEEPEAMGVIDDVLRK